MSDLLRTVRKIPVHSPEGEYPILVGSGLFARLGALLTEFNPAQFSSRCAIVTNPTVGALYAPQVVSALRECKFIPTVVEIPDGEKFKTLETVNALYERLIDAGLDRRSIIFSLGGGVVGDVAGYVAATFLRGVPFIQIPTTLLAMVDSSIGGKVGVDHPRGKNLIGAFKQPLAVIADTDVLGTLPEDEFRCGMAEVVKHGIIADKELFERLERFRDWQLDVVVWLPQAIQVKVNIIQRDPYEQDERAHLNLGHTFGHAIEKASEYSLKHGEAVAIGIVCAARLAARQELCEANLITRVENLLRAIGLPTRVPREFSTDVILDAMQTDKKRVNAQLRFILPRSIGEVIIADDVSMDEIAAVIDDRKNRQSEIENLS